MLMNSLPTCQCQLWQEALPDHLQATQWTSSATGKLLMRRIKTRFVSFPTWENVALLIAG